MENGKAACRQGKKHKRNHNTHVSKEDFGLFCRLLHESNLVAGSGGNLSVRVGDRIFITPSGYSLRDISPEIVVTVNEEGRVLDGDAPTKDMEMHLGILCERTEINVVCHVHGAYIIAVSTLISPGPDAFPPVTPGFAYFAHPLQMLPFMVPGTKELAIAAAQHFSNPGCGALLLQNHGLVTIGESFREALNMAEEIDEAARIYILTNGKAKAIPAEEVSRIKNLV